MNEQDCSTVYDELVDIVYGLKLGWITEQVMDVISAGKTTEEIVSGRKTPDLKLGYHTPQERLLLLIDGIEQAVVHVGEIEGEIAEILTHEAANSDLKQEIRFTSSFESKGKVLKFSPEASSLKQEQVKILKVLLEQLRQETIQDVS